MLQIIQAESAKQIDDARRIFRDYETWLGMDLCFQGFEEELRTLPGKYSPPDGRLYLAYSDEKVAGSIALRQLKPGVCEMKRLFVRDEFRGTGLGKTLIEKLIADAREIGYREMLLDTYPPKMGNAVKLYESHGFREIPPYYENPHDGVLYMNLIL